MTTVNGKSVVSNEPLTTLPPPAKKAGTPREQYSLEQVMTDTGSTTCREARLKMNEGRHSRNRLVMLPIDPRSPRAQRARDRALRQVAKIEAKRLAKQQKAAGG